MADNGGAGVGVEADLDEFMVEDDLGCSQLRYQLTREAEELLSGDVVAPKSLKDRALLRAWLMVWQRDQREKWAPRSQSQGRGAAAEAAAGGR